MPSAFRRSGGVLRGLLLVVMPDYRIRTRITLTTLDALSRCPIEGAWLAATLHHRGDDTRRMARLERIATTARVPLIATSDVLYHVHQRRPLQDVLCCIREKATITTAGRRLQAHAERHLRTPRDMMRLFRPWPDALAETIRFADRISFTLDQLKYQYPDEPVPPGKSAQQHLEDLTSAGVKKYFPQGIDDKLRATLRKELALIAELDYAHYFLTVHDIVRWARGQNILCQGAARRPIPRFVMSSASPRSIRPRSTFCSSASSRRSGWSRRISTSISSTPAARR